MDEPIETKEELEEAYASAAFTNRTKIKSAVMGAASIRPAGTDEVRGQWAGKVAAFLGTEMGNGIPTDNLIALLADDPLGPHMEAIEQAGFATLAICDVCELGDDGEDGIKHDLIVVRLETLNDDPWQWIDDDNQESYCPFGWDDTAEILVRTAMSICERIYWPTDTERLQGLSLGIVWPMGYSMGSDGTDRINVTNMDVSKLVQG